LTTTLVVLYQMSTRATLVKAYPEVNDLMRIIKQAGSPGQGEKRLLEWIQVVCVQGHPVLESILDRLDTVGSSPEELLDTMKRSVEVFLAVNPGDERLQLFQRCLVPLAAAVTTGDMTPESIVDSLSDVLPPDMREMLAVVVASFGSDGETGQAMLPTTWTPGDGVSG
jgi:hypothetical protein